MKKLILTFDVLNNVNDQEAFNHGIELAQVAMTAANSELVNTFVGIEVKDERRTHPVEISCSNSHRGHKIWYNGRHWKASRYGVEMSGDSFAQILHMIDVKMAEA